MGQLSLAKSSSRGSDAVFGAPDNSVVSFQRRDIYMAFGNDWNI